MIVRAFFFLIGFGFAVAGGVTTIAFLNVLTTGHGFIDYLLFISKKASCYLLPIGIFTIWCSLYLPLGRSEIEK